MVLHVRLWTTAFTPQKKLELAETRRCKFGSIDRLIQTLEVSPDNERLFKHARPTTCKR